MSLSPHQTAAVATSAKQVLVTAVPGAGKTTTLVARVLHMLEQGIAPRSIVVVTFTRHAAAELRQRIGDAGRGVFIGTLHSFCLRLIREMGQSIGYEWDWLTIEDEEESLLEQYDALSGIGLLTMGSDGKRVWKLCKAKEWETFSNRVEAGLQNPDGPETRDIFRLAWAAYMDLLRSQNTLTYGTILTEAYRLLETDRKALALFRNKYRHFLIDEAQDTSHLQWSIVWRLVKKAKPDSLYVVGDMDQAIYEWRGAAPHDLLAMARNAKTTTFTLPVTHRFGPGIAGPAQRLIEHNTARIPTKIETVREGGETTLFHETIDLCDVVSLVDKAVQSGGARSVAVLSRRHRPLIELEKMLAEAKIPCRRIGRLATVRSSPEFKVCLAYIRLSANKRDRRAFARVATMEGITAEQMRTYRTLAAHDGKPIADYHFPAWNEIPWRPDELQAFIFQRDRERDYSQAIGLLREAVLFHGLDSPAEVDRWFALADVQDELAQTASEDVVTLATVHSAKGLEWPTVIVVDCCEQIWPSGGSLKEGREEEERRLLYVAITRARDRLYVCPTNLPGELRIAQPSRFIAELG